MGHEKPRTKQGPPFANLPPNGLDYNIVSNMPQGNHIPTSTYANWVGILDGVGDHRFVTHQDKYVKYTYVKYRNIQNLQNVRNPKLQNLQ